MFEIPGRCSPGSPADEPLRVGLKCEPQLAEQLRMAHPAITGGYHLNQPNWNRVALDDSLPPTMIVDLIEDSYARRE